MKSCHVHKLSGINVKSKTAVCASRLAAYLRRTS